MPLKLVRQNYPRPPVILSIYRLPIENGAKVLSYVRLFRLLYNDQYSGMNLCTVTDRNLA